MRHTGTAAMLLLAAAMVLCAPGVGGAQVKIRRHNSDGVMVDISYVPKEGVDDHLRDLARMLESPAVADRLAAVQAMSIIDTWSCGPALRKALRGDSPEVSAAAAQALGRLRYSPALGDLLAAARKGNVRAVEAAGALGGAPAAAGLIELLDGNDAALRLAAIRALGQAGDKLASGPILKLAKDPSPAVRAAATEALAALGDPAAADAFLEAVASADKPIRLAGVAGLARLREARGVKPLAALMKDKDHDIRLAAIEALGVIGDASAGDALYPVARDKADADWGAALLALARVKDARAYGLLTALLAPKDTEESKLAVAGLGELGDKKAVESLIATYENSEMWKYRDLAGAILVSLAKIGGDDASRYVLKVVRAEKRGLSDPEIEALALLRTPEATTILAAAYARGGHSEALADALGAVGGTEAASVLIDHVRSADSYRALARIKDPRAIGPIFTAGALGTDRKAAAGALAAYGESAIAPMIRRFVELKEVNRSGMLAMAADVMGPKVMQAAADLLRDSNEPHVRWEAAEALGKMADPEATTLLLRQLKEEKDKQTAGMIILALGKRGDPRAVEPLVPYLSDRTWAFYATQALGNIPCKESVAALMAFVKANPQPTSLGNAIESLGFLGDPAAVGLLLEVLAKDPQNPYVAEALGRLGDANVVPALIGRTKDPDFSTRSRAYEALIRIGTPEAIAAVEPALKDESDSVRKRFQQVLPTAKAQLAARAAAASAPAPAPAPLPVAQADTRPADGKLAALLDDLKNKPSERARIIPLLGELKDRRAVDDLIPLLKDPKLRSAAALALAKIGDPKARTPLLALTREGTHQFGVYLALVQMGEVSAIQEMLESKSDEEEKPYDLVEAALDKIGPAGLDEMLATLKDGRSLYDKSLAGALAKIGGAKVSAAILDKLLNYPTGEGDEAWEKVLGRVGIADPAPLLAALKDSKNSPTVRRAAAILAQHKPGEYAQELVSAGAGVRKSEQKFLARDLAPSWAKLGKAAVAPLIADLPKSLERRLGILIALARIGDPQAAPAITEALAKASREDPHDREVMKVACDAIVKFRYVEAAPVLADMLRKDNDTEYQAFQAVGGLGLQAIDATREALTPARFKQLVLAARRQELTARDAPAVGRLLASADAEVLEVALEMLDRVPPAGADALAPLVNHPLRPVRLKVITLLGEGKSPQAKEVLPRLLMDKDLPLAQAAARSLAKVDYAPQAAPEKAWYYALSGNIKQAAAEGNVAVGPLLAAAQLGPDEISTQAVAALDSFHEEKIVTPLAALYAGQHSQALDEACLGALARYGDRGTVALLAQVRDGQTKVRSHLESLGLSAVPALLAGLDLDPPAAVRASIGLLAKAKARQAVGPLIDLLQHDEPSVVAAAASALAGLADANDLAGVWDDVQAGAVDVRLALPVLAHMPADRLPPGDLSPVEVRPQDDPQGQAHRLWEDPAALVPVLGHPSPLAALAAVELDRLRDAATPALAEGLKDANPAVRAGCAVILARRDFRPAGAEQKALFLAAQGNWEALAREGAAAVPMMVEAVKAAGPQAAGAAKELGKLKEKSAAAALEGALSAKDDELRHQAAQALAQLDWQPPDLPRRVRYLAALEKWEDLAKLGPEAAGPLLAVVAAGGDDDAHESLPPPGSLGKDWLAPLRSALKDPHPAVRAAACRLLGRSSPPESADTLASALEDKDRSVAADAAMSLARLKDARCIPALLAMPDDSRVAYHGMTYFLRMDANGVEPLMQAFDKADPHAAQEIAIILTAAARTDSVRIALAGYLDKGPARCRLLAAGVLAGDRDPAAAGALVALLKSDDASIRASAAALLAEHPVKAAGTPLAEALKDKDASVRQAAAAALGASGQPESVQPLVAALEDKSTAVRGAAAGALGRFSSQQAALALVALLTDDDSRVRRAAGDSLREYWSPPTAQQKAQLAVALGEFAQAARMGPEGLAAIALPLKDADPAVRGAALLALASWESDRAVALATPLLEDKDPAVRGHAAIVLAAHGDARATPLLRDILRSGSLPMKRGAVAALGASGGEAALPLLIEALQDSRLADLVDRALRNKGAAVTAEMRKALRGDSGEVRRFAAQHLEGSGYKPQDATEAAYRLLAVASERGLDMTIDDKATVPIEVLAAVLKDRDAVCKPAAIGMLARAGTEQAVGLLVTALKDPSAEVRLEAATSLEKLSWQAKDAGEHRLFLAARGRLFALSRMGAEAVPALAELLKDADASIRRRAALGLARIYNPQAQALLTGAMLDWEIAPAAAAGLRKRGWRPQGPAQTVRFQAALRDANAILADWPGARKVLLADIQDANAGASRLALMAMICLGQEDTVEDLRGALARTQDEEAVSAAAQSRPDLLDRRDRVFTPDAGSPALKMGRIFSEEFGPRASRPGNPCEWGLWRTDIAGPARHGLPPIGAQY